MSANASRIETHLKSLSVLHPLWAPRFFYRVLLWLAPLAFLGLFFFYPLARILSLTFDPESLTAQNLRLAYDVLRFTLYQALLSTFLTLLLGLPSAGLFARFDFRGRAPLPTPTPRAFIV